MSKIIIIGGSGFLGSNLTLFARRAQKYDVYSTFLEHKGSSAYDIKLDITDKDSVRCILKEINPDVVIHTAAITNSNYCATHKQLSWDINVQGTQNIAEAVSEVGSRLIFISTDQIYSGKKQFFTETDIPDPISFYGRTKFEAELTIASINTNYCILRTSLIYGLSKTNRKTFFDEFVYNLLNNKPTKLFYNEYRTPIFLDNYCEVLMELVNQDETRGIYNVSGHERMSRYEMGTHISNALLKDESLLIPISMYDYEFIDGRPEDCSMSNKAITKKITTKIIDIKMAANIIFNKFAVSGSDNIK